MLLQILQIAYRLPTLAYNDHKYSENENSMDANASFNETIDAKSYLFMVSCSFAILFVPLYTNEFTLSFYKPIKNAQYIRMSKRKIMLVSNNVNLLYSFLIT